MTTNNYMQQIAGDEYKNYLLPTRNMRGSLLRTTSPATPTLLKQKFTTEILFSCLRSPCKTSAPDANFCWSKWSWAGGTESTTTETYWPYLRTTSTFCCEKYEPYVLEALRMGPPLGHSRALLCICELENP
jgi:hypothetical protein